MNDAELITMMQGCVGIVGHYNLAAHEEVKEYTFKALPNHGLQVGDFCVVPTKNGFSTITVTQINVELNFDSKITYKLIVGKLDLTEYEKQLEVEAKIEKIFKKARKKREIEVRKSDLSKYMDEDDKKQLQLILGPTLEVTDVGHSSSKRRKVVRNS